MRLRSLKELDDSEGNVRLHNDKDTAVILYPAPSPTDPNDPLRWPLWRKHVAFGSVCAFAFLSNYAIGGLAPAFYILSMEFGKSQHQTSELLLWPVLVFGVFVSRNLATNHPEVYIDMLSVELPMGPSGQLLWQTAYLCLLHSFALCLLHLGRHCAKLRKSALVEHYWCLWRQCL